MKLHYLFLLFGFSLFAQDVETLSWDKAMINEKVPMTISKADFDKIYKKTDSITAPLPDQVCTAEEAADAKMLYYKGVRYELNNGMLNFRSIDFSKRKNMYFSHKDDWFDQSTTLKTLVRDYPVACSLVEDYITEDGEEFEMVVFFPEKSSDKFEWRFFFKNGRLHSIEAWLYCK
jgi:hypothetical protein